MFEAVIVKQRNSCAQQQHKKQKFREVFHQLT
jgi:hypothetical protein